MNKKVLTIGIALLMIAIVTAAIVLFLFPYSPDQPPQADDSGSTTKGIQEVVTANNQFAFDLYSEFGKTESGNIFYSPYSISSALAMTYEGAREKTAEEMKSVFYFPETNTLRTNFAAIYNDINKKDKEYQLSTGNALWVQQDYQFLQDYLTTVEKYYRGKAANVDFVKETEKSRQTINTFIEQQTNDKIKDLIPEGVLNSMTRLVLTNAIYFKGTWEWEFDKSDTRDQEFKITPTNTVQVPMMYMKNEKANFNYLNNEDVQILELPYKGNDISMLIILPKDNLESIESSLTFDKLLEWKNQMKEEKIDSIYLPKFKFDTKYFMKETLSAMGMPTSFSMQADFSGMTGNKDLFISSVIHQAFVQVDETGTEAAAATAVVMKQNAVAEPEIFKADHPFVFIIQEKETGNILFIGRVVDPR